ncbi:MAG: hypothetical protein ACREPV_03330 [Lysobacter sp.]
MTKTNYISEFHLFVLARPTTAPDGGAGWEPQWIHGDMGCGLAVYCSALDAEIVRAQRIAQGESGWRRMRLQDFPVLELVPVGTDQLICQMVYGFLLSGRNPRLVVSDGRIQPVYLPMTFKGLEGAIAPVTLDFVGDGGVFDGMRSDWTRIGAKSYPQQITKINQEPGLRLANLAHRALKAASPVADDADSATWGIFQPYLSAWSSGEIDARWRGTVIRAETG